MSTQTPLNPIETAPVCNSSRLFGGIFLIGLGLLFLAAQFIQAQWMGLLILPLLSVGFLLWGLFARNPGLLVPGGILGGIGLGTYLNSGLFAEAGEQTQGGVFMLAFAAGWALIVLLSLVINRVQWWPLIPGGIMAVIGAALLAGGAGVMVLEWLGKLWPLILIAIGWPMWRKKPPPPSAGRFSYIRRMRENARQKREDRLKAKQEAQKK